MILERGSKGEEVIELQCLLRNAGYHIYVGFNDSDFIVDGIFGKITESVLNSYLTKIGRELLPSTYIDDYKIMYLGSEWGELQRKASEKSAINSDKATNMTAENKNKNDSNVTPAYKKDTMDVIEEPFSNTFTLKQLTYSNTANRNNIDNTIRDEEIIENLRALCNNIIDVIKARYTEVYGNVKFLCTSGYRCHELNKLVKGVSNSQHTKGEAVDFVVTESKHDLKHLFIFITRQKDVPFDQVIYEVKKNSIWIHISHRRLKDNNRGSKLLMNNGKYTEYTDG